MKKKIRKLIKRVSFSFLYLSLGFSYFVPRKKNIWLFGGVAAAFSDNVKYLFIYVTENCPDLRAIWISKNRDTVRSIKAKGFEAYYKYSIKGIYYPLIGNCYFFFDTVSNINFWTSGGAVKVNLWHGVPIKKIEFDIKNRPTFNLSFKSRFLHPSHYAQSHYILSTSKKVSELFASAFRVDLEKCLALGYPRNEILSYSEDEILTFVEKYEPAQTKTLIKKIKEYKKVFVYMPTWRDNGRDFVKAAGIDFGILNNILKKKNYCLILKLHHRTKLPLNFESNKNIFLFDNQSDIYPILPFTDCLITDYSSIYFDYKLMRKEVILFPFDKEDYLSKDRDMYYSYDLVAENQLVAHNFTELIALIQSETTNINDNGLLKEMIFETKDIESSKEIVKSVMIVS